MKRQMQKGSTLIELMIFVAIIAILAAIAIPAYSDYVKRAKVSGAIAETAAAKTALAEYYQTNGSFPADLTDVGFSVTGADADSDIEGQDAALTYLQTDSGTGGTMTFTFDATVIETDASTITLVADVGDNFKWDCTGGTVSDKYRPANCQ